MAPPPLPSTGAARNDGSQNTHFIRRRMLFSDPGMAITSGGTGIAGGVSFRIGRLPARAYITLVDYQVVSGFAGSTAPTLQLGSTVSGAEILASASISAAGITHATAAAGLGLAVTSAGDADVYARYVQTGGIVSAGDATIVIGFQPDNDG